MAPRRKNSEEDELESEEETQFPEFINSEEETRPNAEEAASKTSGTSQNAPSGENPPVSQEAALPASQSQSSSEPQSQQTQTESQDAESATTSTANASTSSLPTSLPPPARTHPPFPEAPTTPANFAPMVQQQPGMMYYAYPPYPHHPQPPQPSYVDKPKRAQVKNACTNCQKACKRCDNSRPCGRCVKYNLSDCVDSERKKRQSSKRGPYKRRSSGPIGTESSATPTSQAPPPVPGQIPPPPQPLIENSVPGGPVDRAVESHKPASIPEGQSPHVLPQTPGGTPHPSYPWRPTAALGAGPGDQPGLFAVYGYAPNGMPLGPDGTPIQFGVVYPVPIGYIQTGEGEGAGPHERNNNQGTNGEDEAGVPNTRSTSNGSGSRPGVRAPPFPAPKPSEGETYTSYIRQFGKAHPAPNDEGSQGSDDPTRKRKPSSSSRPNGTDAGDEDELAEEDGEQEDSHGGKRRKTVTKKTAVKGKEREDASGSPLPAGTLQTVFSISPGVHIPGLGHLPAAPPSLSAPLPQVPAPLPSLPAPIPSLPAPIPPTTELRYPATPNVKTPPAPAPASASMSASVEAAPAANPVETAPAPAA